MAAKRASNRELEAALIAMSARISVLEKFCATMGMAHDEPIEPGMWLPVKSAAFELGVTVQRIGQLVKEKKLRRRGGARPVLIDARGLENFKLIKAQRSR